MKKISTENEVSILLKLKTNNKNFELNIKAKRKWAIMALILISKLIYFYAIK